MYYSPLHQKHESLGAKFSEFGGWLMPLQYSGVVEEHFTVRETVGVFDVSHLGKISVIGKGAKDFLNQMLTNDLNKIPSGKAQYTMLCTEAGGVVDDMIAYLNSENDVFLIPNAANTGTVAEILKSAAPAGVTISNRHHEFGVLAVQGPNSIDLLADLGLPTDHEYMSFVRQGDLTICRTGYTGEIGFELVVPNEEITGLWDRLLDSGQKYQIHPAGLAARDTLRTEMGYALHGQDISVEIDPVSAGLSWAIGWKKDTFRGEESLRKIKAEGPKRRQRGLLSTGKGIPRPGMKVLSCDGEEIGVVTSGTFSPTLKQGIALALVDVAFKPEDNVNVQVRKRTEPFVLIKPPFVDIGVR